ncbi:MAG: pseudouridine synthase [Candidatus Saccharimonadales bacterium]
MRLNLYIAQSTGLSRRAADRAVSDGRVRINGRNTTPGQQVNDNDEVMLDDYVITPEPKTTTIMLNKPVGYVCSRDGQGSKTVYDLIPRELHHLKSIGRLDKESSGLLLMTNDGKLAYELTHPSFRKFKTYNIAVNLPLEPLHRQMIADHGVMIDDGVSKLQLERINPTDDNNWRVTMHEGRNRQIRKTLASLGYKVVKLHRTKFGQYLLGTLAIGKYKEV